MKTVAGWNIKGGVGKHRPTVPPFLSVVDRRKWMRNTIREQCLADEASLSTPIPSASVVERMGLIRAPVAATLPSQPAAKAFATLWQGIKERLELPTR